MSTQILKWTYDSNRKLMYIDRVENGLKCYCTCPSCGVRLNARNKGSIREHHFAHADPANCRVSPETILHMRMKQLLMLQGEINLPWLYEDQINTRYVSRMMKYEVVDVEKMHGEIIPDVVIRLETGDLVFLEVKVSHGIDASKLHKVKEMHASMLEIDLSHMNEVESDDALLEQIQKYEKNKRWIYSEIKGAKTTMIEQQYLDLSEPVVGDIMTLWKHHNICFGGLFRNVNTNWMVFIEFNPEIKYQQFGVIYGRLVKEDSNVVTKSRVIELAELPQWKIENIIKKCT